METCEASKTWSFVCSVTLYFTELPGKGGIPLVGAKQVTLPFVRSYVPFLERTKSVLSQEMPFTFPD